MFRVSRILAAAVWLIPTAVLAAPQRTECEWPHAWNSTIPSCITLVGLSGGVADPAGTFSVTVRDCIDGLPHSHVTVDFTQCAGIHVGSQASQPLGETVSPGDHSVALYTDDSGVASFDITGAGNPVDQGPIAGARCAQIYADGLLMGSVTVRVFDLDGTAGVGLSDLTRAISDFYRGMYVGRSDYDCSGRLGMADLSIWATNFYASRSTQSPNPYAW